jgi:hypothetical protein
MKVALLLAVLSVLIVVSFVRCVPTPCCTADQWEGYEFAWDERHHFRAGINISYDYTNKRLRTLLTETQHGNRERVLESIALFAQKKIYVINHRNNVCHVGTLNDEMHQNCIPSHASFQGSIVLGGALAANLWAWEAYINGTRNLFYEVRTAASCIPIEGIIFVRRNRADVNSWWDITKGIKNPAIFTPPSNCNTASDPIVSIAKSVTDGVVAGDWHKVTQSIAGLF